MSELIPILKCSAFPVAVIILYLIAMAIIFNRAPYGHEDENGFHYDGPERKERDL